MRNRIYAPVMALLLAALLAFAPTRASAQSVETPPAATELPDEALEQPIRQQQFLKLLVSAYECLVPDDDTEAAIQMAIDDSRISSRYATDKSLRAALELNLLDTSDVSWTQLYMDRATAAIRTFNWKNVVRTRIYGTAADTATVADALDELGLALYIIGAIDNISDATELAEEASATPDYSPETPLTREIFADVLVRVYEALYGEISTDKLSEPPDDTESESVRRAVAAGLMPMYKASLTFEPGKAVLLCELSEPVIRLMRRDAALCSESVSGVRAQWLIAELLMSFTGVKPETVPVKTVMLARDWDWYVNQLATGEYSANNCLPSCGEMALNFIKENNIITTAMLRALSPHDGEGWFDFELTDTLEFYGVELESEYDMTLANMLRDIDAGKLIIATLNYDGAASGHAVVVLGYQKCGSGTWLIVNDPYSKSANKYGQPNGYNVLRESGEMLAAMNRHASRYMTLQTDAPPVETDVLTTYGG